MLPEDKKRQILETVKKMEQDGIPKDTIQRLVDNFKTKYDVPETQVASKSPFLAQPVQKTAQDFGRQPIDVSKKEIGVTDYLKSAGRGLLAGGFNTLSNVASVAKPFFPDTGKFSGGDFLNKVQDLKYVAKDLNNQNMQEAVRTRQPQLAGTSDVGQLLGGEFVNPINYTPIPGGSGLKGRLLRGGINAVQGQISYNKDINPGSRLETAATDLGFGALMPKDLVKSISNLSKNRVANAIKNLFPQDALMEGLSRSEQSLNKEIANKATNIFKLSGKGNKGTVIGMQKQNQAYADVIKEMAKSADELNITDELGNIVEHKIPKNRGEFATQLKDFQNKIYNAYSDVNPDAKVNLTEIANALDIMKADPKTRGIMNSNTTFKNTLDRNIENLRNAGEVSAKEAQGFLEGLNQILAPVYQGGNITDSKEALYLTAGLLRKKLDDTILNEAGDLYKPLKELYGKTATIADQVNKSVRKQNSGVIDQGLDDIFNGMISAGVFSLNPGLALKGAVAKGTKNWLSKLRSPDRQLTNLFKKIYDKNLGESVLSKAAKQTQEIATTKAAKLAQENALIAEQQALARQNYPLAEQALSEGKMVGPGFTATQPTTNYSLQRGQGVQLRPGEGVLPKKDYRLERPSSYDFPETKTNKIVRNPNLSSPEIKGTDYNKLASEMKMPKTPTQSRVKAIIEKKVAKKLNPTKSQGLKETVKKNESPKAPTRTLSKTSTDLVSEAKKYKTAEEFIKAMEKPQDFDIKDLKAFTNKPFEYAGISKEGRSAVEKYKKIKDIEPIKIGLDGKTVEQGHHRVLAMIEKGQKIIKGRIDLTKSQLENIWKQANNK